MQRWSTRKAHLKREHTECKELKIEARCKTDGWAHLLNICTDTSECSGFLFKPCTARCLNLSHNSKLPGCFGARILITTRQDQDNILISCLHSFKSHIYATQPLLSSQESTELHELAWPSPTCQESANQSHQNSIGTQSTSIMSRVGF